MFHVKQFDVIVIGGGHAGAEAAAAAARCGVSVALVTLTRAGIGVMSCNPAIGGLGKGHLVREIDAMDGIMGRAGDAAGIQFRLLNRRKGPAVQGPRAQADRRLYRDSVQRQLAAWQNLKVIEGEVTDFQIESGRITAVDLADGRRLSAGAVVLTTGTFLNGVIHIGDQRQAGGRMGDRPSIRLAEKLGSLGLLRGRLKTGTPPRLDGATIRWEGLEVQPGDDDPVMFSFLNRSPAARQVSCGITHTNARTHDIVRRNLSRSAMYGGHIEGVGPRYCPSIEDKIVRFADKETHQIFLEPEGLDDTTIYPNGISTSLPAEVQEEYVRSIAGLEQVKILQPGYAIEYDYFDPRGQHLSLELRDVAGLFFAGQINGTTGYEEAAAQGLVAGLNAARLARGQEAVHFSRASSYIGVMIDDLTSRGVTEPYRMFTSRAEYRLNLRADNADQRLTELGIGLGCVSETRATAWRTKAEALESGRNALSGVILSPRQIAALGVPISQDGIKRTALTVLAFADTTIPGIANLCPEFAALDTSLQIQIWCDALYAQYAPRQQAEADAVQRDEATLIPADFNYDPIASLSGELKQKLNRLRPENLLQAGRIEGMTPAALTVILAHLRRGRKARATG
jgi:tRNA uridine 5-carboxymethylaminomethyl modification enzyme